MDYSKTLNLPKTDFPMKANLPKREPEIQKVWEEEDIYNCLRRKRKDAPMYILHDGPPYANGDIHMGHALNKVLKDIIVKYKLMSGFDAPFRPGWDCHGLPIEYSVLKEIGAETPLKPKELRKECEKYVRCFVRVQMEQFKRLGIFGDWKNPYLTINSSYSERTIEMFEKLVTAGYIYKSVKPVYWCINCQTALAEAEVEYIERTDPSIWVRFKIKDRPRSFLLIWTTTPWTLPANVAIAVHPRYEYQEIKVGEDILIMARELVDSTMNEAGISNYEVIRAFEGAELEEIRCTHPFIEREVKVVLGDYVTLEQGTGCVHIAPGHGIEDYETGITYKLPVISPVDERGRFTEDVALFSGQGVFAANPAIIETLNSAGSLFHNGEVTHSYPHCWRCKKPIIFRATSQWFINLEANDLRKRTMEAIKDVEWIPDWGEERLSNMLRNRSDWCISRQRVWGVPIPAFYCKSCGEYLVSQDVIRRVREVIRRESLEAWFDKGAEEFTNGTTCNRCGGTTFCKETDILDVWFESGSSWAAVLDRKADLYLEGSDQHRGWFQSSLLIAIGVKNESPYKTVLTHGFMLDKDGRAMHKSLGNVISPLSIVSRFGSDVLRLFIASSDYRDDIRLGEEILKRVVDTYRKIRNTFRFILGNLYDFNPSQDKVEYNDLLPIDKYILHRLQELIEEVNRSYERFEFYRVTRLIVNFCIVDLSSFYLDILKDRLYTSYRYSKDRWSAQTVLYEILRTLLPIMAPILSFTTEEIWQSLPPDWKNEKSVYLVDFPHINEEYLNEELVKEWKELRNIREDVNYHLELARSEGILKSSLEAKVLIFPSKDNVSLLRKYEEDLRSLFIVSQVRIGTTSNKTEIKVEHADGSKCSRCWNYSETVGKNGKHPVLCSRCISVIERG
ncbi:MAG: isoleucine--tRNA ligase [bacterium]|nr:isoleucine--tRNA ligase [bacterium]